MDGNRNIKAVWLQQLQFAGACCFAVTLWLRQDVSHILLILTLLASLFRFNFPLFRQRWPAILILIQLFIIAVLSSSYGLNKKEAFFVLEKQMTLFLIPFLLGASIEWSQKALSNLLSFFSISVTIAVSYLLAVFYQSYFSQPEKSSLGDFLSSHLHHAFSEPLHLHATYLSMYVCFAIAICMYRLYCVRSWEQWISLILLAPLLLSLILLSSRIILVPFALILVAVLPFFLRKRALLIHAAVLVLLLLFGIRYVGNFSAIQERFRTDTLRELNISTDSTKSFRFDTIQTNDATRAERWNCAMELIREQPWLGYGTGMEKQMLNVKYEKYKLSNSISNNFDAHNQYLAYMIKSGVMGLVSFLLVLLFCFYKVVRIRNFYGLSFLLIVSITALTEDILESNKGILFFAFFSTVFCFWPPLEASSEGKPRH